jgi:hypothetical protein
VVRRLPANIAIPARLSDIYRVEMIKLAVMEAK